MYTKTQIAEIDKEIRYLRDKERFLVGRRGRLLRDYYGLKLMIHRSMKRRGLR